MSNSDPFCPRHGRASRPIEIPGLDCRCPPELSIGPYGRRGEWQQTYLGKQFFPLDPRPEDIDIIDIAHHLSLQCRFAGACSSHYSVAQHSILVSHACEPQDALWGLLHDSAEAYLQDMIRPLKRTLGFADSYIAAETRLMAVICQRFGLQPDQPASVTRADTALLLAEKRDLMAPSPAVWHEAQVSQIAVEPYPATIRSCSTHEARRNYLARFYELGGQR